MKRGLAALMNHSTFELEQNNLELGFQDGEFRHSL